MFQPVARIGLDEIDTMMDAGAFVFVLDIPPGFEADVLAGRMPTLQLNTDATAMTQAGHGSAYIAAIVRDELVDFVSRAEPRDVVPATLVTRAKYNPNLESGWFMAVMQVVDSVTILALILSGAAVIREREHGTIEHLLVMPVTPLEFMAAKIWANGLVILLAAIASLILVVQGLLRVPVAGSVGLFALGTVGYLFAVCSLGIMLATVATTMPQFGLLSIPVFVVLNLLSGGITPLESMPEALQAIMQASPATHYVRFSQAVLFRGAGIGVVWADLARIGGIGLVFFVFALARFRRTISATG
jgi:ABC-2 type transport system permease protein